MAGIKRSHEGEEHENQEMMKKKSKIVEEDAKVSQRGSMIRARYADFIAKYTGEEIKRSDQKELLNKAKPITDQELLFEKQQRRQQEREAARLALETLEKSVRVEDRYGVTEELEVLAGCSMSRLGYVGRRRMEKLGLFFKDDFPQFVC